MMDAMFARNACQAVWERRYLHLKRQIQVDKDFLNIRAIKCSINWDSKKENQQLLQTGRKLRTHMSMLHYPYSIRKKKKTKKDQ